MTAFNARANDIFLTARDLPPGEQRNRSLDQLCGQDLAIRQQVDELLLAYGRAHQLPTESPPVPELPLTQSDFDTSPTEVSGVIGVYKLLQRLGEGGMGVVWLAEQEDRFAGGWL